MLNTKSLVLSLSLVCILVLLPPTVSYCKDSEESIPENKKVIIYIDLTERNGYSAITFSSHWKFEKFSRVMNLQFPDRPIRAIFSDSLKDAEAQVERVLNDEEQISHLFFLSHGASSMLSTDGHSVGNEVELSFIIPGPSSASDVYSISTSDLKDLNRNSIGRFFSALRGRFSSDSRIVFHSCHLLKEEEVQSALTFKAQILNGLLNLTEGSIYGHRTVGISSLTVEDTLKMITTPFFMAENPAIREELLGWHALAGATLTTAAALSYGLHYLCKTGPVASVTFAIIILMAAVDEAANLPLLETVSAEVNVGYRITVKENKIQNVKEISYPEYMNEFYEN